MAGHHDRNPFSPGHDINPFSNHHNIHGVTTSSKLSTLSHEPALYGHGDSTIDSLDTPAKLKRKQKELEAKEAELNKREQILRRKEEALARSGAVIDNKNWPSFYPIVHHDIAGDIPVHVHRIMGANLTFLESYNEYSNIFGVFVFFSAIYFLLGTPGAFYFWYRPLYRAFRTNNGTNFGCFFFNYVIMSFIGSGFFTIELVLSIWVMQQVYRHFRNSGQKATISVAL
nr:secretory carrier-associated membrane protein 3-like [Tanacetum cinerariifolium]